MKDLDHIRRHLPAGCTSRKCMPNKRRMLAWLTALASAISATGLAGLPDPVAYWPFDGNADDASGNGHNGSIVGGVDYAASGVLGQAAQFHGTGYINVPNDPVFRMTDDNPLTISFWVSVQSDGKQGIIGKFDEDIRVRLGFYFWKDNKQLFGVQQASRSTEGGGGNEGKWNPSPPKLSDWQFVTLVKNPVSASYYDCYQNGQPLTLAGKGAGGTSANWPIKDDVDQDIALAIGNFSAGLYYYEVYPLLGVMDELRVYNVALSSDQVLELHNSYPRPGAAPTVDAYPYPEPSESAVITALALAGFGAWRWRTEGQRTAQGLPVAARIRD